MSLMSNNKNVDDDDNRYDDGDDDDLVRSDLCPYDETQTMSHIVESCPLTKPLAIPAFAFNLCY